MNASSEIPPPRIAPHAARAMAGVWRLTSRRLLAPGQWLPSIVVLVLVVLIMLASVHPGRVHAYYEWIEDFYVAFLVPILAFISGAGAARDDTKSVSVDYVLIRPVRRPVFLVAHFLSQWLCLEVAYLIGLAALVAVGWIREIPGALATAPLFATAQIAAVAVFTAAGFFAGAVTGRYIVLGLIYGWIVEAGIGQIPTQINRLSITRQLKNLFVAGPRDGVPGFAPNAFPALLTLLAIAAGLLLAAILVFSSREFTGEAGQEN